MEKKRGKTEEATQVEAALALEVLPLYLQVVWGLQDRYALEPAGSHGVWGLVSEKHRVDSIDDRL